MKNLRTWRTAPALSPLTIDDDLVEAATAPGVQTTTWTYANHPTLPLVRAKQYPERPMAVEYAYSMDGSLATRDWERSDGTARLRTTYLSNSFGQTEAIHYGTMAMQTFATNHPLYTPSLIMDYDRAGRVRHRTDASGTVLHIYRYDGSSLTEFTVDGSDAALAAGRHLRRSFDASGRQTGLESAWGIALGAVNGPGSATVSPNVTYPNQTVRVMPGNPSSPYQNSQSPYVRQTDPIGNHFRAVGTMSALPNGGRADPAAHIPLQQFIFRP